MSTLTCPKCQAPMRTYERNRVHVDQCTGCGGIFLDRGELEALTAAEQAFHGGREQGAVPPSGYGQTAPPPPGGYPPPQQPYAAPPVQQYGAPPRYTHSGKPYHAPHVQQYGAPPHYTHSGKPYYGHRRHKSFLEELFD